MNQELAGTCLFCQRNADEVPLISVAFRGTDYRICAQHLPLLIHDPSRLEGLLPGAEDLKPADDLD